MSGLAEPWATKHVDILRVLGDARVFVDATFG